MVLVSKQLPYSLSLGETVRITSHRKVKVSDHSDSAAAALQSLSIMQWVFFLLGR